MNKSFLIWLKKLIRENQLHKFYTCGEWKKIRADILKKQNSECQICKQKRKVKSANTVHHVNHVRNAPELALSEYYTDRFGNKQRNLIAVCRDCHKEIHKCDKKGFINKERW